MSEVELILETICIDMELEVMKKRVFGHVIIVLFDWLLLSFQDPRVCHGIVETFSPLFQYVIKELGSNATSDFICGVFYDEMCLSEN